MECYKKKGITKLVKLAQPESESGPGGAESHVGVLSRLQPKLELQFFLQQELLRSKLCLKRFQLRKISNEIFLNLLLGELQLLQPLLYRSKFLHVNSNQDFYLGSCCLSIGYDLLHILGDDLRFPGVINQSLVAGLEFIEVSSLLRHLLIDLLPFEFLSNEELV